MTNKHIVISGCSFTNLRKAGFSHDSPNKIENPEIKNWQWGEWLQEFLKDEYTVWNYGSITNDNKTIATSIVYGVSHLLKNGVDPQNITVLIQWSTLHRNSWFVSSDLYKNINTKENPTVGNTNRRFNNWPHTTDFLTIGNDKSFPYEHGYFHLSGGGYNPTKNPYDLDPLNKKFIEKVLSDDERCIAWFESMFMLQEWFKNIGIDNYKSFTMQNSFSRSSTLNKSDTINGFGDPYFFHDYSEIYDTIMVNKKIRNTWNDSDFIYDNPYVRIFSDKIDFDKWFWFFEEEQNHKYGGIIEWTIRNFYPDELPDIDGLPKVLWYELNHAKSKKDIVDYFLEKDWYGHTSSIMYRKFVVDVILKEWRIFDT